MYLPHGCPSANAYARVLADYFDRSGTSKVALQDKQLNKLLHWSSRNIILLPGPARESFLSRVKWIYG